MYGHYTKTFINLDSTNKRIGEHMKHIIYNFLEDKYGGKDFNYRFMEPPIIIYYITTMDEHGNMNVAPISLGTYMGDNYFSFSLVHGNTGRTKKDNLTAWQTMPKDTANNLDINGECVISYCTKSQIKEMRITGCPIPAGIDEGEIAGYTYYPSSNISVPSIKEIPVNMEARIVKSEVFGMVKLYVCQIVAVHVGEYYDELDKQNEQDPGLILTDPIFEIYQEDEKLSFLDIDEYNPDCNFRMNVASMNVDTPLVTEHADIGPRRRWLGTFEIWMQDEMTLGNISRTEYDDIMDLFECWKRDKNPKTNGKTKSALTSWIKTIIWERNLEKYNTN